MTIELRPYQVEAMQQARAGYQKGGKSCLLVMPTGAGKTAVFCSAIQNHIARPETLALVLQHRTELISQAAATLGRLGVPCRTLIAGKLSGPEGARTIVASVDSVRSAGRLPNLPTFVVWDEAHHCVAESWKMINDMVSPSARQLMVTATPQRLDGKPMGDVCDFMVVGCTVADLIAMNRDDPTKGLVPVNIFSPSQRLEPGDHCELASTVLLKYLETAGKVPQTAIFAPNIDYSLSEVAKLKAAGVRAEHVDGTTMPAKERAAILARLSTGEIDVISNVGLLAEGWDLPSLQCVIGARRFTSAALWLQFNGRVMRPFEGKLSGTVFDLTGAVHEHGHPEWPRVFSLNGDPIQCSKSGSDMDEPSGCQCLKCGAYFIRKGDKCPMCGAVLAVKKTRAQITHDKMELFDKVRNAYKDDESARVQSKLSQLIHEGRANGYKPGWAITRFKIIAGYWPSKELLSRAHRALSVEVS